MRLEHSPSTIKVTQATRCQAEEVTAAPICAYRPILFQIFPFGQGPFRQSDTRSRAEPSDSPPIRSGLGPTSNIFKLLFLSILFVTCWVFPSHVILTILRLPLLRSCALASIIRSVHQPNRPNHPTA